MHGKSAVRYLPPIYLFVYLLWQSLSLNLKLPDGHPSAGMTGTCLVAWIFLLVVMGMQI